MGRGPFLVFSHIDGFLKIYMLLMIFELITFITVANLAWTTKLGLLHLCVGR